MLQSHVDDRCTQKTIMAEFIHYSDQREKKNNSLHGVTHVQAMFEQIINADALQKHYSTNHMHV